jgi:hypothetical protein
MTRSLTDATSSAWISFVVFVKGGETIGEGSCWENRYGRLHLAGLTGLRSCQSLREGKSAHNGENLQRKPQPYGIPDALLHETRTDYRAHNTRLRCQ